MATKDKNWGADVTGCQLTTVWVRDALHFIENFKKPASVSCNFCIYIIGFFVGLTKD